MPIITKYLNGAENNPYPFGFVVFTPDTYSITKQYPVIIYLHDLGERGDGIDSDLDVLINGIPASLKTALKRIWNVNNVQYEFVMLCPQLDTGEGSWPLNGYQALKMQEFAIKNLSIDIERIYVTGKGFGGGGTFKILTTSLGTTEKFAAAVPICGVYGWTNLCHMAQANTGIWAFHGDEDEIVGVGNTHLFVNGMNSCNPGPNIPAKKTIYTGLGHEIWETVYDPDTSPGNEDETWTIYEYLLNCKLGAPVKVPSSSEIEDPIANAGPDQTISLYQGDQDVFLTPDPIILDGSDNSTNWETAYWEIIQSPAGQSAKGDVFYKIHGQGISVRLNRQNLLIGTYVFRLTVKNSIGTADQDLITVNVQKYQPTYSKPVNVLLDVVIPSEISSVRVTYENGGQTTILPAE